MRMCNSICNRTGTRRIVHPYDNGHVYCSSCAMYFNTDKLCCVCCKTKFRVTSVRPRKELEVHRY